MNALIVHAHPDPLSMNAALRDAAVRGLRDAGANVAVSDLYAEGFQAVASRSDFLQEASSGRFGYVHEQRHAAPLQGYAADIIREQERVATADFLLFQFPLWWYAVPAILKGWADRVLSYGFAYTDQRQFDRGLLKGKRAMLSVTTGGTREELLADERYTGSPEQFLKPFSGGVLGFTGMNVLPALMTYAPSQMNAAQRTLQLESLASLARDIALDRL
jgi:NAD(P)H dehydrogenase (quinone)